MNRQDWIREAYQIEKILEMELDVSFAGEDGCLQIRLEISKSLLNPRCYKVCLYREESYRILPTFPQNDEGDPVHEPSDEFLWVEDSFLWSKQEQIFADDVDGAMEIVLSAMDEKIKKLR